MSLFQDSGLRLVDLVGSDLDDELLVDEPTPPSAPIVAGGMEWAPQQQEAIAAVIDWYQRDGGKARIDFGPTDEGDQVFRLFGYAGTGKTTLARAIVEELGLRRVAFAAFTGKAAYVLRTKGCEGASTVHSLIYQPVEKVRAHLEKLRAQLRAVVDPFDRADLLREIAREQAKVDSPDWILKEESELEHTQLLVLDEVSMVGERMARDLLSYGCKILCLGDPAQLPPVDGGGYFINAPADYLLTDIHRSALDSPVTRIATTIRNSQPGQPGQRDYGIAGRDGDSGRREQLTMDELLSFDQILVGRNATRWQAVHLMRALRGLQGQRPVAGDKVICLANSGEAQVFNGQQFEVLDSRPGDRDDRYWLTVRDDDGLERDLTAWAAGFRDLEGEKQAKRDGRGTVVAATFAHAITTHKSQGSQWPRVLVVDEASVFYGAALREAEKAGMSRDAAVAEAHLNGCRWLYTATTRASQQAVIVPRLNGLVRP